MGDETLTCTCRPYLSDSDECRPTAFRVRGFLATHSIHTRDRRLMSNECYCT